MSAHCYRLNYIHCFIQPLFGGRLLFRNYPQVGKPTWGYDYTTALRRLPSPSDHYRKKTTPHRYAPTARCIAIQKTAEERLYTLARGWLAYPVTPCAHIATAEERLYTLARGWLAYPVTSTHSQLPPKCGCINTQKPTLSRLEVPQKQSFRLRNRSRKLFRFGF